MNKKKKKLIFKLYKLVNIIPFNNVKRGKTVIENKGSILLGCKVISEGYGNVLRLCCGGVYRKCIFAFYGNNNVIEFGEECYAKNGSFYIEDSNNKIVTGNRTNYTGKIHIACTESKTVSIGDDCIFSSEIVLRSGDSHSIIDMQGIRINQAQNIIIDNHVWVGHRVLINKGVVIPENCIVGTGAVLTKQFSEKNSVIAGVPAKVVKSDVNWMTQRI